MAWGMIMALTPQPTLAEMTQDVLAACGEGGTGVASASTLATVESFIRRAQKQIQDEAPWTIAYVTETVSLLAGELEIEFPDGSEPGLIHLIRAERADSPQYAWNLEAGITTDDRSLWLNISPQTVPFYAPSRYLYINGMIEVGPASAVDINLTLQYELGAAVMVEPGDRPNCDGLAVVMQAEILFRNARGGDFRAAIPKLQADLAQRIMRQKAKQMAPESFTPGDNWNIADPARRGWDNARQRHWMWRDVRP